MHDIWKWMPCIGITMSLLGSLCCQAEAIHDAVKKGDLPMVTRLLTDDHTQVNAVDSTGFDSETPLYYAVKQNNLPMVELLIRAGANVNATTKLYQYAPLHQAKSVPIVTALLEAGANVNIRDDANMTPLMRATSLDVARTLIDRGADVNAKTQDNQTPLGLALAGDHFEIADLLVISGADLHSDKLLGKCWLQGAIADDSFARLDWLLAHRIVPTMVPQPDDLAFYIRSVPMAKWLIQQHIHLDRSITFDYRGRNILHYAAENNAELVAYLLEVGIPVDKRDRQHNTPLWIAAKCGNSDAVQLLLAHGADVNAKGASNATPLIVSKNARVTQLLLEKGATIDAVDQNGMSALCWASSAGNVDSARLLLEHGADANHRNRRKETPAHWAYSLAMLNLLVQYGVKLDVVDAQKVTVLHTMAKDGSAEGVAFLLAQGLPVNARSARGRTPLMQARHSETIELLLQHGADINAQDHDGYTALHFAVADINMDTLTCLLRHHPNVNLKDRHGRTALYYAQHLGDIIGLGTEMQEGDQMAAQLIAAEAK